MPNYPLGIHMQKHYKSKGLQHFPITIQSHYESNHIPFTESCDWALGVLNAGAAGNAALAQATPARLAGHTDP